MDKFPQKEIHVLPDVYYIWTKCRHKNAFSLYLMLPKENSYPMAVCFLSWSHIEKEMKEKNTFLPSTVFHWASNGKAHLWKSKTTTDRPHLSFFLTNTNNNQKQWRKERENTTSVFCEPLQNQKTTFLEMYLCLQLSIFKYVLIT